jgi:DNA polymerase-1
MEKKEKVVLVDGNSLLYRTYFALPSLTTSDGVPTGGVYGFTNILLKLLDEIKPDYVAFAFDLRGPTFRHLEYKEYKAQRPKAPSDLIAQIALAKELAEAFGIPVFEKEGFEADDCIATLTRQALEKGKQVIILSGDLDSLQLVSQDVVLMTPLKGISQITVYDPEAVKKRFGLSPGQILDYKALIGDPSDNIPRIPGIGERTAQALLSRYGSLSEVYRHIEELDPKIREVLIKFKPQLEQNLRLSALRDDLDLAVEWDKLRVKEPDQEKLLQLFSRLEFKTLIKKFAPVPFRDYLEIDPLSAWERSPGPWAMAIILGRPSVLALASKGRVYAQEVDWPEEEFSLFSNSFLPIKIKDFLEDESLPKWVHDTKNTVKFFWEKGINLKGIKFDSMLASYLLNSSRTSHSLEQIYLERIKQPLWKEEANLDPVKRAAFSVCAIRDLTPILESDLREQALDELLISLEIPLSYVLADMELTGIKISTRVLEELKVEAEKRLSLLEKEIFDLCGTQFNLSSPKQLSFVLFEKLQLSKGKRTKTGYSTDISVLEGLRELHPVIKKIIEHRELSKLKNTYIDALPGLVDPEGRVHTTFLQTSTATGRLSSVNPNLQNIPVRSEFGGRIRKAFIASSKNHFLLSADYSQIELRVLAHLSGDQKLKEIFFKDGDIHTDTACRIFKVSEDKVTSEMRRVAKTVNFGVIYGMSSYGLSQAISVSREEAQAYIDSFFQEHRQVKEYLERILETGRAGGFVTTILGRRRYIPDLNSSNKKLVQQAERMAINAPIQGSAADIIKLAMIELYRVLKEKGLRSKLVLQVHDELVLDCPQEEMEQICEIVRRTMSQAFPLSVPLKVELKRGADWFEMEKINA